MKQRDRAATHPIQRRLVQLLVCITAALSLGCATPPANDDADLSTLSMAPRDLGRWQASGKASFRYEDEAETARFLWQRTAADAEIITLKGPFSLNHVTLLRQDGDLWWQHEGQLKPLSGLEGAPTLTKALQSLPGEYMGDWLLGYLPEGGDWQVTIREWQRVPPWRAPARVTIVSGGIEIKVIISQWEFSPAT